MQFKTLISNIKALKKQFKETLKLNDIGGNDIGIYISEWIGKTSPTIRICVGLPQIIYLNLKLCSLPSSKGTKSKKPQQEVLIWRLLENKVTDSELILLINQIPKTHIERNIKHLAEHILNNVRNYRGEK
jgi:hypothetical protein